MNRRKSLGNLHKCLPLSAQNIQKLPPLLNFLIGTTYGHKHFRGLSFFLAKDDEQRIQISSVVSWSCSFDLGIIGF